MPLVATLARPAHVVSDHVTYDLAASRLSEQTLAERSGSHVGNVFVLGKRAHLIVAQSA
jgi:hypothetical protein